MKDLTIPKAILFDLDGTIITSETIAEQAWQEACSPIIKNNKEIDIQKLLKRINENAESFWNDPVKNEQGRKNIFRARTQIVETALSSMGITDGVLASEIAAQYSVVKDKLTQFFPNTEAVLEKLKEHKVELLILTNGEAEIQRGKIRKFKLNRYFTTFLIEGEMGYGKPDSRVYQKALARIAVNASETWMVGNDLLHDLSGAKELGIFSIWCDYTKKGLPTNSQVIPDVIINDISEILTLIEKSDLPTDN